jgi:hypothetical protein
MALPALVQASGCADIAVDRIAFQTTHCNRRFAAIAVDSSPRYPGDDPVGVGRAWWQLMLKAGYLPDNYAELDAVREQGLSKSNLRAFDRMARLKVGHVEVPAAGLTYRACLS